MLKLRLFALLGAILFAGCSVFPGALFLVGNRMAVQSPEMAAEAPIPQDDVARYEGIPQSYDEDGFPVLGDPDAPVQVVEYGSFDCPHCGAFHEAIAPSLIERARQGEIRYTYAPVFGTGNIPNGLAANGAALCAGEQDAFWSYHSTLFYWQGVFGSEAFDFARLSGGAANLGLDMAQWTDCFERGEVAVVVDRAIENFRSLGLRGTPSLLIDGQQVNHSSVDAVNAAIDAALSQGEEGQAA